MHFPRGKLKIENVKISFPIFIQEKLSNINHFPGIMTHWFYTHSMKWNNVYTNLISIESQPKKIGIVVVVVVFVVHVVVVVIAVVDPRSLPLKFGLNQVIDR